MPTDITRGWMSKANCADVTPIIFFPHPGETADPAKAICGACDVTVDCLEYALTRSIKFGIWGGTSEKDRRKIKRTRRIHPTTGLAS